MGKNKGFRDRDLTIFPSGIEKLFNFRFAYEIFGPFMAVHRPVILTCYTSPVRHRFFRLPEGIGISAFLHAYFKRKTLYVKSLRQTAPYDINTSIWIILGRRQIAHKKLRQLANKVASIMHCSTQVS
jgi:hypothetical protein